MWSLGCAAFAAFLLSHFPPPSITDRVPRVVLGERGLVDPPNIRTCSRTRFQAGCKNCLSEGACRSMAQPVLVPTNGVASCVRALHSWALKRPCLLATLGRVWSHSSTSTLLQATLRGLILNGCGKSPRLIALYKLDRGRPVFAQTSFLRSKRMVCSDLLRLCCTLLCTLSKVEKDV